jgi:hypothetical protein
MMNPFRFVVLVILLGGTSCRENEEGVRLQADPAVQSFLRGMISKDEAEMFSGTEDELRSKLGLLVAMTGNDDVSLVRQLLWFAVDAKGMREAMLPGVLLAELDIETSDIADGTISLINVDNEALRQLAFNWLGGVDGSEEGEADFSRYEEKLRGIPKPLLPTHGLVGYMFDRDPLAAVVVMVGICGTDVDLAEAVLGVGTDHRALLEILTGREEWWARLYVAEVMRGYPQLRDPTVLKQLAKDPHAVVRRQAARALAGE